MELYDWQRRAHAHIAGQSAVLSAPTGAGKTLVAYLWAGLLDEEGRPRAPEADRVLFTAPIKALSNERYLDLRRMGLDVGIETGDFKRNESAKIVCCTQEIYTMKYAARPGQKLIVDELHYIFTDPDRARTYIDGLRATLPETPILVMSATFGGAGDVGRYLSRMCSRPFVIHESTERATRLIFETKRAARREDVRDALVFVFSQKGAAGLARDIAATRSIISPSARRRLEDLAAILDVRKLAPPLSRGVGIYHGGMLPKEKLLVESAFRERLLDVVCGTNALALGVNLPAQWAVFAQLVQYHSDEPISKNEFLQMAGRAGRKGLFDPGYVTWLWRSPFERRGVDGGKVFRALVGASPERARVTLRPSYGRLLRRQTLPEVEAEHIARCSLPRRDEQAALAQIEAGLRKIERLASRMARRGDRARFLSLLAEIWYDEMEVDEDLEMALLFFEEPTPSAIMAAQMIMPWERNWLQALLKVKRFANHLPPGRRFRSMDELDRAVDEIDPTIYGFEERIGQIEQSR